MATRPGPRTPTLPIKTARLLASQTGLHYSYVNRVLRGERRPSLDAAKALATAYRLTLDEFFVRLRSTVAKHQAKTKTTSKTPNKETLTR